MSPEEQLRRLRDADRWEDTTLTPRAIALQRKESPRRQPRGPAWVRAAAVAAAVVLGAGLLFGATHPAQSSTSASSGERGGPAFGSVSSSAARAADAAGSADALLASIAAPPKARPGTTIAFTVALKNTTSHMVSFAPCPTYTESVTIGSAHLERHGRLDCRPVGDLKPGGSAAFAMRIALPAHAVGDARIGWSLDGGHAADATVVVAAD